MISLFLVSGIQIAYMMSRIELNAANFYIAQVTQNNGVKNFLSVGDVPISVPPDILAYGLDQPTINY